MRKSLFLSLMILLTVSIALAQAEACPALIRAAVESAMLECANVEIGQACYGSSALEVDTMDDRSFTRPGDVTSLAAVESLRSRAFDVASGQGGMALIRAQANIPEQNLLYVIFGDVTLQNTSTERAPVKIVPVRVTFPAGANSRTEPSEDAPLAVPLTAGQVIPATGRLADNTWIRLFLPEARAAWVRADLIRVEGQIEELPEVTAADVVPTSLYSPMLVFNFSSGIDDAPCTAAPNSGILVQTADEAGVMSLIVNGIALDLEGTFYLQARPQGGLFITALEGEARLISAGTEAFVTPGNRVEVRWDNDQLALGAPRNPQEYQYVRIQALPLSLLPRKVDDLLEFNLLGVVTPAAAAPLENINAESQCTVAAVNNEGRMRTGPSREYPIHGGLFAGESANPEARTEGSDGMTWWQLAQGMWVRSDIVLAAGNCSSLPVIGESATEVPEGEATAEAHPCLFC